MDFYQFKLWNYFLKLKIFFMFCRIHYFCFIIIFLKIATNIYLNGLKYLNIYLKVFRINGRDILAILNHEEILIWFFGFGVESHSLNENWISWIILYSYSHNIKMAVHKGERITPLLLMIPKE